MYNERSTVRLTVNIDQYLSDGLNGTWGLTAKTLLQVVRKGSCRIWAQTTHLSMTSDLSSSASIVCIMFSRENSYTANAARTVATVSRKLFETFRNFPSAKTRKFKPYRSPPTCDDMFQVSALNVLENALLAIDLISRRSFGDSR